MRVLVLGASGMLGNTMLRLLAESDGIEAIGTVRGDRSRGLLPESLQSSVISGVDVENIDSLTRALAETQPDVVVNCIGLVKQLAVANDPLVAIPINTLLPHRLARLCALSDSRFIHISTDCVFSGSKGMYVEGDAADAQDLYGLSKFLGEVDYPNAITLRTSIIGHELDGARSLVGWFLAQSGLVKGYRKAIFSGLPTVELARVVRDYVLPNPQLHGLYHVSAESINKYDLLQLVASVYGKKIDIAPNDSLVIDRSLDSTRFRLTTGFQPKAWADLITSMKNFG
jgi:dTDP-4-dehydrorhamnose reductase